MPANEEPWTLDITTPPPALTPVSEATVVSAEEEDVGFQEPTGEEQQEPEVLLYGPLHEAFGKLIAYEDTAEPVMVAEKPPAPIEEYPPARLPVQLRNSSRRLEGPTPFLT